MPHKIKQKQRCGDNDNPVGHQKEQPLDRSPTVPPSMDTRVALIAVISRGSNTGKERTGSSVPWFDALATMAARMVVAPLDRHAQKYYQHQQGRAAQGG